MNLIRQIEYGLSISTQLFRVDSYVPISRRKWQVGTSALYRDTNTVSLLRRLRHVESSIRRLCRVVVVDVSRSR